MIVSVSDTTGVAEARRRLGAFARDTGIDEPCGARLAIVVTELVTNLLKHAGSGEILAVTFEDRDGAGLDVLALDKGPGMADVDRCLRDGYSTVGTPGNGLGAVIRQADKVRIYSREGKGTAVAARFVRSVAAKPSEVEIGNAVAACPGETLCGDEWGFASVPAGPTLLVVDGLGHGPDAHRAAAVARETFMRHAKASCEDVIVRIHEALRPTRGGAVAVARIDTAARLVRFVGLGNIAGALVADGGTRHMISNNGTAGHIAPRIREFQYPYSASPLVLMHSDGLTTRWDLAAYPGLAVQHPSLVAGVLFRDYRRGRDDATVVAMRASS